MSQGAVLLTPPPHRSCRVTSTQSPMPRPPVAPHPPLCDVPQRLVHAPRAPADSPHTTSADRQDEPRQRRGRGRRLRRGARLVGLRETRLRSQGTVQRVQSGCWMLDAGRRPDSVTDAPQPSTAPVRCPSFGCSVRSSRRRSRRSALTTLLIWPTRMMKKWPISRPGVPAFVASLPALHRAPRCRRTRTL